MQILATPFDQVDAFNIINYNSTSGLAAKLNIEVPKIDGLRGAVPGPVLSPRASIYVFPLYKLKRLIAVQAGNLIILARL